MSFRKKQKISRIDRKILSTLQREGRERNNVIAEQVGLSPSACLQHIRKLEDSGVIRSYCADVDFGRLNGQVTVFTRVTLTDHKIDTFKLFEKSISACPFVTEMFLVSGGFDYLIKFEVAEIEHYQQLIEQILESDIGVREYFSFISIRQPIARRFVSVDDYFAHQEAIAGRGEVEDEV